MSQLLAFVQNCTVKIIVCHNWEQLSQLFEIATIFTCHINTWNALEIEKASQDKVFTSLDKFEQVWTS